VVDLDLENKAKASSYKTVQSHFPPIYKNIVHEKFHQCIKKGGCQKRVHESKARQSGEIRLPERNIRKGSKGLLKEICKQLDIRNAGGA
jgi:hypothetical protein